MPRDTVPDATAILSYDLNYSEAVAPVVRFLFRSKVNLNPFRTSVSISKFDHRGAAKPTGP